MLGVRQYSALALTPRPGLATGRGPVPRCLRKMTPLKGDRAREFNRGRSSPEDYYAPGNSSGLGEARGCRARGILVLTTLLTQDPAVVPPQRTHPLPLPRLAAFGAPTVRFPQRGAQGSGCWHLLARTWRLPSCSAEIMLCLYTFVCMVF